MDVYGVNITKQLVDEKCFQELLKFVSIEKQSRIGRFRKYQDALRALTADILVRSVICSKLGLSNNEIIFAANQYGKPYLNNITDMHFNVSHSGDWVVGAFDTAPVGIDIEKVRNIDLKIAERFFSKDENDDLMKKGDEEKFSYFCELWSLKESYIKAIGKGLSIPLDSFSIRFESGQIKVTAKEDPHPYYFQQYSVDPDYKMAVCTAHSSPPRDVEMTDIFQLSKYLKS